MSVFDRYAPFVQDFIYDHGWEDLRSIQVAAAEAIFDTDDHVLLAQPRPRLARPRRRSSRSSRSSPRIRPRASAPSTSVRSRP